MRSRITPLIAAMAINLALCAAAQASTIYTVSNNGADFGKIDTTTGVYTGIATAPQYNYGSLATSGSTMYAILAPGTGGTVNKLSTVDPVTGLQQYAGTGNLGNWDYNGPGGNNPIMGMAFMGGTLYGYGNGDFGTISTVTGNYTTLPFSPDASSGYYAGRLVGLGSSLYANPDSSGGQFGTVDPANGSFNQIASGDNFYRFSRMFTDNGNLYAIYNTSFAPSSTGQYTTYLYSINPATGAYTQGTQVTGFSGGFFKAIGNAPGAPPAAVPEPSTYALLCLSMGVVGFARKKMTKTAVEA
jgi:PEP-CTERM motif